MRHKNLGDDWCPIARSLDSIGDWWSLLIVRDALAFGKRRFGEFQKSLGLARNILASRLRKLVAHGILESVPASDGSAYQEYVLTERGRSLYVVLTALRQWGEQAFEPGTLSTLLVDAANNERVRPLELRAQDGRLLGPADIKVVPAAETRPSRRGFRKWAKRRERS